MAILQTKWIADDAISDQKFKARNNQYIRARNNAGDADVNIIRVNSSDEIEFASAPKVGADDILTSADKGAANGVAELDATGKVPASQLPSYVDDVLEFADLASFPGTGETGKLYVALDTNLVYRWSGSTYVEISASAALTANDINYTQGDTNDWTVADGSSVKATLDEVGERLVTLEAAPEGYTPAYEVIAVSGTDISNGFVTLSQTPIANSVSLSPKGGLEQEFGVDFTLSGSQLNFAGDLSTYLAVGDKLLIKYVY